MADLSVLEFRAMGSQARVVVDGEQAELAAETRDLIWMLEQRWSRFIPTSEVSTLNRAAGRVTRVSEATYELINNAVKAHEATGGLFNPLMLRHMETHGYQRSWDEQQPVPSGQPVMPATNEPIVCYPEISAVRLPEESRFDPGGIGKRLAIDLAIELCVSKGAVSASVEIGGDLRVHGKPWYGPEWQIRVANPFDPVADIASFTPTAGAVTTSSTQKRRWASGDQEFHHLLDPSTGYPSTTNVVAATTCSEVAWWSEVAAKSALIAGGEQAISILDALGTPGAIVTADGRIHTSSAATKATAGL